MIRKLQSEDRSVYLSMVKEFYASSAVHRSVPERHFADTFAELMRSEEHVVCYLLETENRPVGYALLMKTFSQEAGGRELWIDELFVLPEYRCRGLGHEFFAFLEANLLQGVKRVRLEISEDNCRAKALYERMGFQALPYSQMSREL